MQGLSREGLALDGNKAASNFESNWRRKQEMRCRPYADKIYRSVFGDGFSVSRCERGEDANTRYLLDREFAVDAEIRLANGMIMTGQEKFLSYGYAKWRSVTVEYMQNPITNERGDWFRLASQYYFVGYENEQRNDFSIWILLNWPAVVVATNKQMIKWYDNKNREDGARASFRFCLMDTIPDFCIIAKRLQ